MPRRTERRILYSVSAGTERVGMANSVLPTTFLAWGTIVCDSNDEGVVAEVLTDYSWTVTSRQLESALLRTFMKNANRYLRLDSQPLFLYKISSERA